MINSINELKSMILEKNVALDNLCCNCDKKKIEQIKRELDSLLYQFYKDFLYMN
jgi:hypothetical protein